MKSKAISTGVGAVALALAGLGFWNLGAGLWIDVKAVVAQHLLKRAWARTAEGESEVKPWPWADTWPVARIEVPRLGVSAIVLAGGSGEALAFGPGHLEGTPPPGEAGVSVIAGHRDTHFKFLRQLEPGDELLVTAAGGAPRTFIVTGLSVVKADRSGIDPFAPGTRLALVTCWPLTSLRPGGDDRYVVLADLSQNAVRRDPDNRPKDRDKDSPRPTRPRPKAP